MTSKSIQVNYVSLTLLNTFAASFIWGINTLFLLDAGLNNTEAFAANAFFTLGMVIFEVPTGVVADTLGRRTSYLLGAGTLFLSTILYLLLWKFQQPFWAWALASIFLGLGFTFFTGAVDAWLVDALNYTGFTGSLEDVFAKGQISAGIAMLTGSALGGYIAQYSNLGVPFIIRSAILLLSFVYAAIAMKDLGFTPRKADSIRLEMRRILKNSLDNGLRIPSVRWAMLIAPFTMGAGVYGFYAAQPFLLELYGDKGAYGIAGLAAALVASAQIFGGLLVPKIRKLFKKRSSIMFLLILIGAILLILLGLTTSFVWAIVILGLWGLTAAALGPIRQAYLNKCLQSDQRATILSFDGLMGSTGGVIFQPALGKSADIWSYSVSYLISGAVQLLALPFVLLVKKEASVADNSNE